MIYFRALVKSLIFRYNSPAARLVQRQNGVLVRLRQKFDSSIGLTCGIIVYKQSLSLLFRKNKEKMAKKGAREIVAMVCEVCKSQNYVTERNKVNMQNSAKTPGNKLILKKFCKICKKVTSHKENSKLK